jgi:hypothetical protein
MLVSADPISIDKTKLSAFKSIISDCNKKLVNEKCTKYHVNLSESPISNKTINLDLLEYQSESASNLAANDDNYERTINNSFRKKLRKRSTRSMMLFLNFSN